jgi:hypothetical protein
VLLEHIREATSLGRPLGSEEFLVQIEQDFGVKITCGQLGRPKKPTTAENTPLFSQLTLPTLSA